MCASFAHHMLRITSKKTSSAKRKMEGIVDTYSGGIEEQASVCHEICLSGGQ